MLPTGVFKLTSATNENILIALSSNSADQNALFVYQYYIQDGKRLQSAWHKWTFGTSSTDKILNIDFIENTLYIVNQRGTDVFLESLDISPAVVDASANYLTYLDRKFQDDSTGVSSSYNAGTNVTTFTIPYTKTNTLKCVGRVGGSNTAGQALTIASQSGTSLTISGDQTSKNLWFGEQYEFSFVFSQQFIQIADTNGARISTREGRLQIRNWNVSYNDTGFFTTEVIPVGRSTSTSSFTGTTTGSGALGTVALADGDYTFAVQSENDKLTISLKNDSHLPSNFINASWQGYYVTASARE